MQPVGRLGDECTAADDVDVEKIGFREFRGADVDDENGEFAVAGEGYTFSIEVYFWPGFW